ncbi:MAG: sulfite exporter TauE/SafE family protein [Campylobacteraceae bacterium]|nr:sulfite exporter TauE/SafE family protein [Campylobacteraceae bacterium]
MVLILLALGVFIGFASGFFGIGGGTVLVPILLLVGLDIKTAIGISVVQMVFSSVFGSYINYKSGALKLNDGIYLGLGGFIGATQSGLIVALLSELALMSIFIFTLLLSIYKLFRSPIKSSGEAITFRPLLFLVGIFVGMIAVSIGVGGALFLTPLLVGFLRYDIKRAVSMGLFFVIFSSISGLASLAWHGFVDFQSGIILGIGSLLGVYFGTKQANTMPRHKQKRWLIGLYVLMLILTFYKLVGQI